MNLKEIKYKFSNDNSTNFRKFLLSRNLNNIIVFCCFFTIVIMYSILQVNHTDTFLILSSALLCIYIIIIFLGIIFKKKNSYHSKILYAITITFYLSTIIWTIYSSSYFIAEYHDFYFFMLIIMVLTSTVTVSPIINIVSTFIIIFYGSHFIKQLHDFNSYLWVILMAVSFFSVLINYLRFVSYKELFNQEQLIEEKNDILTELSYRDFLTNFYNNRYALYKLDDEIERALRYKTPLGLILLNINEFTTISHNLGQLAADDVLYSFSQILTDISRSTDIIGRYSSSEFIIILPNTDFDDSIILAERIRITVNNYDFEQIDNITISIGLKPFDDSLDLSSYIDFTEDLLYKAKHSDDNTIVY